jgi:putative oligomerization/nucleic acid binding protein
MRKLTPEGEKLIEDIARRHQVSVDAVKAMLEALVRGGGTMAQFSHPEFGGSGQWLAGGMTMVGDMFNNALKAKVDGLASELSALLANEPASGAVFAPAFQSQSQSGAGSSGASIFAGSASQRVSDWWPVDLGAPASVGAQNETRYAYFPEKRRLALYRGGRVEILDTGEHVISGFGQQQGGGDSLTLSSQLGTVTLDKLRRIEAEGSAPPPSARPSDFPGTGPAAIPAAEPPRSSGQPSDPAAILSLLEKLGELRDKGVISADEFAAKKTELLSRL